MKKNEMKCLWYEDNPFFDEFLVSLQRAEYEENPRCYLKGIRATLIALGYNEDYINGEFRDKLEKHFKDVFGV